jgi:hypothetical protein
MASPLREGNVRRKLEVPVIAGQKGHPEAVRRKGGSAAGGG